MIKNKAALLALVLLLVSCSISKEVRQQRDTINGTWTLENVGYDGDGDFKAKLFNDADAFCFEGSTWFFRDTNSTGSYMIQSANNICSGGVRDIRWSVLETGSGTNQLQFKFIDEKKNDLYGRTGYRLDVVSLSPSNMTLKSNVSVDGKPISVIYEFSKQ